MNKSYLIFFLLFLLTYYKIYDLKNLILNNFINKKILIDVDVSKAKIGRGPEIFLKGIKEILPYRTQRCHFIPSKLIYPNNKRNKTNFFFIPYAAILNESIYNEWIKINKENKLILGL